MNDIAIFPEEIDYFEAEGIKFCKNTFINILIDGTSINEMKEFEDGTVYWPELKKSTEKNGNYLIFTCVCGIAEDAGWEEINVVHSEKMVTWIFERNGENRYQFDKDDYLNKIQRCEKLLNLSEFPLAVENATFPNYE